MSLLQHVFESGEVEDNAETLGAVAEKKFTVPTNKKWLVYGGYVERDVSGTLDISIKNSSDKIIQSLPQLGAGTTNITWGVMANEATLEISCPIPLKAGDYVHVEWGAAQATPEVTLLIRSIHIGVS